WRCRDCLGTPAYCSGCIRASHSHLPFHRVEKWMNTHYRPAWLSELGICVHLGHGGHRCP
ncbi:hypothetical protein DENSPDRAFT_755718, partial [Dentipellis sp. KUC8613]